MKITLVKKVLADGSPCKKCNDVFQKMEAADQFRFIDRIVIADATDANSEGMLIAAKYNVTRAPFFVVEKEDGQTEIYTVYYKLVKEILSELEAVTE